MFYSLEYAIEVSRYNRKVLKFYFKIKQNEKLQKISTRSLHDTCPFLI